MSYTAAYLTGQGEGDLRAPGRLRAGVLPPGPRLRGLGGAAGAGPRPASPTWWSAAARWPAASPTQLAGGDGVEVVNDVVLNQVLVRFGDDDAATDAVVAAVQRSGECWMGATTWHGRRLMRISVSNWSTTTGRRRPVRGGHHPRLGRPALRPVTRSAAVPLPG